MNSLSESQLKALIDLEARGEITPQDIYRRAALAKVQKEDPYVTRTLGYVGLGGLLMFFAGQAVFPFVAGMWLLDVFKTYQRRRHTIRDISGGNIIDYLEGEDRQAYQRDVLEQPAIDVTASTVETKPEVHSPAAIGPNTRLMAVDVQSSPSDELARCSLIEIVSENPKSSFFAAPARTGKGITIAACIRLTQNKAKTGKFERITFWALTPKQDPKEHWYWETCDKFYNPNIEDGDRTLAARGIYEFINAFGRLPRSAETPTVLVVDELTRLLGLLKGVKMEVIDPELFGGDSKSFSDWFLDRIIYSASMSQSVGFYVWVATPSSAIGGRGFTKGDVDSLNIYTLATRDNLKFADGGPAAFSAPKTESTHPVFSHGFVAGYCHQNKRWYHVPDLGQKIKERQAIPIRLQNFWTETTPTDRGQTQYCPVIVEAIAAPSGEETQPESNTEKPDLPLKEIYRSAMELEQWINEHPDVDRKDLYTRWNAHKKGFTRPQFRYLLTLIEGEA